MNQSKLLAKRSSNLFLSKQKHLLPLLASTQSRKLQTLYKPGQPISFIDAISGIYEDPRFALDCKPVEWRDDQAISWTSFGSILIGIPMVIALFVGGFTIFWTTVEDTSTVAFRSDPFPSLNVVNGKQYYDMGNPAFKWTYPFGQYKKDVRYLYYLELQDAIERRHKIDEEMSHRY